MSTFAPHPPESATVDSVAPPKVWQVGTLTYTISGLVSVALWLIGGDFALQVQSRDIVPAFQFLLKKYDASDTFTALMMGSVPSTLSLFLSPIVSYKSDRHRGKWGRRIPFVLLSVPFSVLAMVGLAFSPAIGGYLHHALGTHSLGANASVLIFFSLFWIVYGFASIIGVSVFNALLNDVIPQHFLGRIFGAFHVVSLSAGIIFNYWIFGVVATEYFWIFLGMGVLSLIGNMIVCLKVKEGDYPPPPPVEAAPGIATFLTAAKGYFQECLGHSYYWWYFIFLLLCGMSGIPVNSFRLYYAISLNMTQQQYGDCVALTYCLMMVSAYPLGALADRFHPLRMVLVLLGLFAIALLCGDLFIKDVWTFSVAQVVMGIIYGPLLTTTALLGLRLLPRSNFAQFSSASGILSCIVGIGFGPAVGVVLDYTHHNYRYTFYMSFFFTILALLCGLVLHAKFMALGGPKNYVAPESTWGRKTR